MEKPILAKTIGGGVIPCLAWFHVEVGDFVVYETRRERLIVLKVFQTENIPPNQATKAWRIAVQKVNMDNYRKLTETGEENEEKTSEENFK